MRASWLLDVNALVGSWPADEAPSHTAETLLATLDALGIERAVVRHSHAIHYDAATGNSLLMTAISGHERLLAGYVVGPLDCDEHGGTTGFKAELDRNRVAALWLYPRSHGWSLRGPEARTLIEQLDSARRPVMIELDEADWSDIDALAEALPEIDIVVCAVGYRTLRQAFAVMSRRPRVRLDTCYLAANDAIEIIVERFGPDRLVFGTSTPIRDAGGALHRLERASVDEPTRRRIGTGTACGLLGLSPGTKAAPEQLPHPRDIVDAHAHIGRWPTSWLPRPEAEHLVASMAASGTAVAIISSMAALWSGDVRPGNEAALQAARRYPGRVYVHAVANPHRASDTDYLDELLGYEEVRGIKVHPHTHDCALDDPRYDWIYELAIRHGIPVLGHSFAGTWHSDPELFGVVASRNPELTLIAGHAGATVPGFRSMIDLAAKSQNLIAEICGSSMTGWWLRRLVDSFGAERVLHGTDSTLIDPRYGVGRVLHAPLDETERGLILSGNARRIYRLPAVTH